MSDIKQIKYNRTLCVIGKTLDLLDKSGGDLWYNLKGAYCLKINRYSRTIEIYIEDIYLELVNIERTDILDDFIISYIKRKFVYFHVELENYKTLFHND